MQTSIGEDLEQFRNEYLSLACSTVACDRAVVAGAVERIYHGLGFAPPEIVWLESLGQLEIMPFLAHNRVTVPLNASTRQWLAIQRVQSSILSDIDARIKEVCFAPSPGTIRFTNMVGRLQAAIRLTRHFQVEEPYQRLRSQLTATLDSIDGLVLSTADRALPIISPWIGSFPIGEFVTSWNTLHQLGVTEFMLRYTNLPPSSYEMQSLMPFIEMARNAHAYLPYKGVCFVSERPLFIKLDQDQRLHCEEGAALAYADSYEVYSWHGTIVPKQTIMSRPSVQSIQTERNIEVKRVLLARYGESKYLIDSGAELIDRSEFGTLYRCEMPGDEPLVMVEVRNSTAEPDGTFRMYYLRVPGNILTAREAVAWTFALREHEYAPLQQT